MTVNGRTISGFFRLKNRSTQISHPSQFLLLLPLIHSLKDSNLVTFSQIIFKVNFVENGGFLTMSLFVTENR